MTFTPTKNRGAATGEKIRTPNIPALRDAWCALVPHIPQPAGHKRRLNASGGRADVWSCSACRCLIFMPPRQGN
jgi:hypothetical protein